MSLPHPPGDRATDRPVADCHDEVCITCSDEAVEVTVVELLDGDLARVDTGEGVEEVSVMLVDAAPGARILVHAKEAIAVVPSRALPRQGAERAQEGAPSGVVPG